MSKSEISVLADTGEGSHEEGNTPDIVVTVDVT